MARLAWLGIGAQRCGTTWFTDLLCQHPDVRLPTDGRKEQHALHWPDKFDEDAYLAKFDVPGLPGEFTPVYMRALTVPQLVPLVCRPEAPLLVLLRDPVDRFLSSMRRRAERPAKGRSWPPAFSDHQWAGMYASQLHAWASLLGRERFVVLQYERLRQDPQAAVDAVWRRLRIDPVPLTNVSVQSNITNEASWQWPDGLENALTRLYAPQVELLAERWGIDPSLWPRFA